MSTRILPPAAITRRSIKPLTTAERVREILAYDPETGVFTWRVATCNRVRVGDVAGRAHKSKGYIYIRIDERLCLAHRIAWLYVTGEWPAAQIDHINGVKHDNRIANLREATNAENMQNLHRAPSNNLSTGELGVTWNKARGKYKAQIKIGGKATHLGYFATMPAAIAARRAAEAELFPFSTRASREA